MRQAIAADPAVMHTFVVSGFDLIGGGNKPNAGTMFIPLNDWSERRPRRRIWPASSWASA
jgi:multidrug efflux pump